MKACFQIVALATASAMAIPVLADEQPAPTQRVEIKAPDALPRAVLSFVDPAMDFQLDNGRHAEVTVVGHSLQLLYRHRRCVLQQDGQGGFVSGDGQVSLRFTLDASGQAKAVAVSAPARWF